MSATLVHASALPVVTPSEGAVGDGAIALRTATASVRAIALDAVGSWRSIGSVLSAPGTLDELPQAMDAAGTRADDAASAGAAVATALDVFADQVAAIRRSRRALLDDIEELRALVAASDVHDAVPAAHRQVNDELLDRSRRLRARWHRAQADLAEAFRAHTGTAPGIFPGIGPAALEPPLVMADLDGGARAFDDALRLPMLARLAAAGSSALEQWAAEHPRDAQRLLDEPPDADLVRRWWAQRGADERAALIAGLSVVVGNLGGVTYADRGRANRRTLDVELPRARARYRALTRTLSRIGSDGLTSAERAEYRALAERIGTLQALHRTIRAGSGGTPRSIVALTLGSPPLAAVAVGDLDTATNVTVNVPGMGSTVARSIEAWTGGAENLLGEQRRVATRHGNGQALATVAWIGYDTPAMPPSTEVLRSEKAEEGAHHLGRFLRGVSGTRRWEAGDHLSVVAHSYGTTTATLAVADTPVDNVVLLASAGIDPRVPDVRALAVPDGHVWASQAGADHVANIGRGAVESWKPGFGTGRPTTDGNPFTTNRTLVVPVPSTHTHDPGSDSWGARTFSSDDAWIDGQHLDGVDGHGATPATEAALAGVARTGSGYLDASTTSLRNTALTSLGHQPDGRTIP